MQINRLDNISPEIVEVVCLTLIYFLVTGSQDLIY